MNAKSGLAVLKKNKVVPVSVFDNTTAALRTAEVLLDNSITILEITLRTSVAYECIQAVKQRFPEMTIGAGSVLSPDDLKKAYDRGAQFAVSPCCDLDILQSNTWDMCYLPGVSSPSELQLALKFSPLIKIFPSEILGGVKFIKAILAPYAQKDCFIVPTGGINENNFIDYYSIKNVVACGMSFIVDKQLIAANDYTAINSRIKSVIDKIDQLQ